MPSPSERSEVGTPPKRRAARKRPDLLVSQQELVRMMFEPDVCHLQLESSYIKFIDKAIGIECRFSGLY